MTKTLASQASMRSVLLGILSDREICVTFLVGAPMSYGPPALQVDKSSPPPPPAEAGQTEPVAIRYVGVPDTTGMLAVVREWCERHDLDTNIFDRLTTESCSGIERYQAAFNFAIDNAGHASNMIKEIVRTAVRSAYTGKEDNDNRAEEDRESWDIPAGTLALAEILVDANNGARTVITTNYDPLLKIAIERFGGRVSSRIITVDGTLPSRDEILPDAIQIIYLHGYWKGATFHGSQADECRTYLNAGLFDIVRGGSVVSIAYGGQHDSFTRALAQVSPQILDDRSTNVVWGFRGGDLCSIRTEHSLLLDSVSDLILHSRFRIFGGVDCHSFFPDVLGELRCRQLPTENRQSIQARILSSQGSKARCEDKLQADLVRYLAYALWEEGERSVMEARGFSEAGIRSILRQRPTLAQVEQLREVAFMHQMFSDRATAAAYTSPQQSPSLLSELKLRRSFVKPGPKPSARLHRLLDEYYIRTKMVERWKGVVRHHVQGLSANNTRWRETLDMIYFEAATTWSIDQMRHFVKSDFGNEQWICIVEQAQSGIERDEWNHLHHANEKIGETLGRLLRREAQNSPHTEDAQELLVIEGGVGGANTTHQVLDWIIKSVDPISQYDTIRYCGFEINELIAAQSQVIMSGHGRAEDGKIDPRSQFFGDVLGRRLKPLVDGEKFVKPLDVYDGVRDLVSSRANRGKFDLFLCSYAFHHIPNGRAARQYIFGRQAPFRLDPRSPKGKWFSEHVREELHYWMGISEAIYFDLEDVPESYVAGAFSPLARLVLDYFPLREMAIRGHTTPLRRLLKDFENAYRPGHEGKLPKSWFDHLEDRQEILLQNIWMLLRPGGLIAIADPDGYSHYNRTQVPKNAEMGVAHFLTLSEILMLLARNGYEIELRDMQAKAIESVRGRDSHELLSQRRYKEDPNLRDPNLGYIAIARKPYGGDRPQGFSYEERMLYDKV